MISKSRMERYKRVYLTKEDYVTSAFDIYERPSKIKIAIVDDWIFNKQATLINCLGKNSMCFTIGGYLPNGKFFVATKSNYGEL